MVELTEQEHTILLLCADGLTATAVCQEMGIALHIFNTRRRDMFVKLGALNTAHAVALAYHKGILRVPGYTNV